MEQHWRVINIDKRQTTGHQGNLGEFFYVRRAGMIARLVNRRSCPKGSGEWVGDRVVCIGEHARTLPPHMLIASEEEEVNGSGGLYNLACRKYQEVSARSRPDPYRNFRLPDGKVWIMRNLTKKQYIREKKLNNLKISSWESPTAPGFDVILHLFVLWSNDPVPMVGRVDVAGPWAGDRIDIDTIESIQDEEGWEDVSEEAIDRILTAITE
ncbi:hypothetical protein AX16_000320 [Volvariella volvacea WC 439]|nr:hypothetical protein AX16_000320 [Volvariella volvacea WC 439]